jgi:type II secretory pathway pseudopilin PulG
MQVSYHTSSENKRRGSQRGYILLTLLLFLALLVIFFAAAVTPIAFQIKRDREEEMIHRGVQYSRAIRKYVKKNGRYPARLEELENTNNIRFLRKRYKDPLTGGDFKILRQGDPQLAGLTAIAGLGPQAAGLAAAAAAGGKNAANAVAAAGAMAASTNGAPTQAIQNLNGDESTATDPAQAVNGPATPGQATAGQANAGKPDAGTQDSTMGAGFSNLGNGQSFGGGPILGVESLNKDSTIREYNKKKHYNEWWFIYDANSDRGTGQITGPYQTPVQTTNLNGQQNNNTGSPNGFGNQGSPFGNSNMQQQPSPQQQPTQP